MPSKKKTTAYTCYIVLRKNGLVQKAFCACPAGIDCRCNHVAATLFCLEEYCKVREKQLLADESCTSQKYKWNVPRKRKGEVVPIADMTFEKHEHGKKKARRTPSILPNLDVRAKHQRQTSNTKLYNILSKVRLFQDKKGKALGLAETLQQNTEGSLKVAVSHDQCYALSFPSENAPEETSNTEKDSFDNSKDYELLSPIKSHPISFSDIQSRCALSKRSL